MKFKIGDKVITKRFNDSKDNDFSFLNQTGKIINSNGGDYPYKILYDDDNLNTGECCWWKEDEIELVEEDVVKQAENNLKLFNKWHGNFKEACETVGITEEQGSIFINILSKGL